MPRAEQKKEDQEDRKQDPGAEEIPIREQEKEQDEFQEGEDMERRRKREYRERQEEREEQRADTRGERSR